MAKKTATKTEKPVSKPEKSEAKPKTTATRTRKPAAKKTTAAKKPKTPATKKTTASKKPKTPATKKAATAKKPKSREELEYDRLNELYKDIPENKRSLVDGLIHQAARLRVQLDDLWVDLKKKGNVEPFQQKNDGVTFDRERPESKIFIQSDKNYLAIIKKLDEMLPAKEAKTGFSKLDD